MKIEVFDNLESLSGAVEALIQILLIKKPLDIAIAGGSLNLVFQQLAVNGRLSFSEFKFWQTDERFVRRSSKFSNYKAFLDAVGKDNVLKYEYFDTEIQDWESDSFYELNTIEKTLEDYANRLEILNADSGGFDLCVLGVGPDGHIASLFPNSNALEEDHKLVAHTQTDNFDVKDRVTLTYPMILQSSNILVVIQGKTKQDVFEKLTRSKLDFHDFPAAKLLVHDNLTVMFGDWE